jgi:hypothetical protein
LVEFGERALRAEQSHHYHHEHGDAHAFLPGGYSIIEVHADAMTPAR